MKTQQVVMLCALWLLTNNAFASNSGSSQQNICCSESGYAKGLFCRCRRSCKGKSCKSGRKFGIGKSCSNNGVCCCGIGCVKPIQSELDTCQSDSPSINPTIHPTEEVCTLNENEIEFDFRGVIFQKRREMINCQEIISSQPITLKPMINIGDNDACTISIIECPNITTNGLVSIIPDITSNGEIQGIPQVTTTGDILVSPIFKSDTEIHVHPVLNADGSVALTPNFNTTGSDVGKVIINAGNDVLLSPIINADKFVSVSAVITSGGNVTLSPEITSSGPVIIYIEILQSKNIFLNTRVTTPNDVIIIGRFVTSGMVQDNPQINARKIELIQAGENEIYLAKKWLAYTIDTYSDFKFIASINTLKQFDNNLFRFVFGLSISNKNDIENITVRSNFLDIYRDGSIILGIVDQDNIETILWSGNVNLVLNEQENYTFELLFCDKTVSLLVNDNLIFERQEMQLYDQGNIGLYGQESFLRIDFIQCVQDCDQ